MEAKEAKEVKLAKDMARKMADYLSRHNIPVKHTIMLEAMSSGFDLQNWRVLRAKLSAPGSSSHAPERTPAVPEKCADQALTPLLNKGCWTVRIVVPTLRERFFVEITDRSLLEGLLIWDTHNAMTADAQHYRYRIVDIIDQTTTRSVMESARDLLAAMRSHASGWAFKTVAALALKSIGEPPERDPAAADAWDARKAPIDLVESMAPLFENHALSALQMSAQRARKEALPENPGDTKAGRDGDDRLTYPAFHYLDERGCCFGETTGRAALQEVLDMAMRGAGHITDLSLMEQVAFCRVKTLLQHAPELIDFHFWHAHKDVEGDRM